jgi:hypothetical protein
MTIDCVLHVFLRLLSPNDEMKRNQSEHLAFVSKGRGVPIGKGIWHAHKQSLSQRALRYSPLRIKQATTMALLVKLTTGGIIHSLLPQCLCESYLYSKKSYKRWTSKIIFLFCLRIRLIIYFFTSRSRIFHLYGDVTITDEGIENTQRVG